jgi:predicted ATPase/class 3 adenylate cyclase
LPVNPNPGVSAEPSTASLFRTFLFTDIEGSTRLWEHEPERMRGALERHDEASRAAVRAAGGEVVKTTGDGVHAVFGQPHQAVLAALALQQAMAAPVAEGQLALKVRCGVHCGECEARDGDYYGPVLNRAARVMGAAHGGQTLVTQAVAERAAARLPEGTTLLDLGTVRLRDLASPERVLQLVHPTLRAQFPPLRSLEATPNNLAQQLNSFVGRERELVEVRQLLAKARLLTLLGMGGIGKSRLSVQLGAELLDDYPDGVWLVELAPLADPLLVPQALASVLGVKEERGASVTEALLAYVRDKTLLVILDNCEHVVNACADLAKRLLQAGPGVRVLTSSRDVLQVAGETVYQVPTLGVPAADDEGADTVPPVRPDRNGRVERVGREGIPRRAMRPGLLSELGRHAAVRLFLDRAGSVQPTFRLDADNAAAVASICRRLDGIPLALELAAARTRALSVQAIAERLKDRFRLLVTGDQTVLPRQRTLRALIDWSFELLSEPERTLFRRLAVFAGGWTLESAEAVCAGDGLDSADVLDLLAQLVQKSLVVMEPGGIRYRMLETVRAYAREKLGEAGDEAATRTRQSAHFLGLAEAARPHLAGPVQGLWMKRLDPERENFIAAFEFSGATEGGEETGVRLLHALRPYFITRGNLSTGLQYAMELLHRSELQAASVSRCMALFAAGQFCVHLGRDADAQAHLLQCADIARRSGNRAILAQTLQPLGYSAMELGQFALASQYLTEAVDLARERGESRDLAAAINALAMLHRAEGRLDLATPLFEEVVSLARSQGDVESTAIGALNHVMVTLDSSGMESTARQLREVLELAETVQSQPVWQGIAEACAGLAGKLQRWDDAARFLGMSEGMRQASGQRRYAADQAFIDPLMLQAREAIGPERFAEIEGAARAAPPKDGQVALRRWLCESLEDPAAVTPVTSWR